jgi:hypothetical protein
MITSDDVDQGGGATGRTEAVPPKVPSADDSGVSSWRPGTAAGATPETPMPPADPDSGADIGGEGDITAVRQRIEELRREIDRLSALVDGAVGKLSAEDGGG